MKYEVRIADQVEKQIEEIGDYISHHSSKEASLRWTRAIRERMAGLKNFPLRHGLAPEAYELGIQLRQMTLGSYRVLYTIRAKIVNVIVVRHGARRPIELEDLS